MGTILSNGRTIYRYNGLILRSPLRKKIVLQPTRQYVYDVGNEYKQQLPTRDFFTTGISGNFSIAAGHAMRKAYLLRQLPQGAYQIWRANNTFGPNRDSGYVYYSGNYSPAMGMTGGSSFLRIPAYEFTLPSKYSTWTIESMSVTTKDHGTVVTAGKASERKNSPNAYPTFAWDAAYNIVPQTSSWRTKKQNLNVGVFTTQKILATDPCNLYSQCQQAITINLQNTDACANAGAANGYPLWETWPDRSVIYNDGTIINAPNNPHFQAHGMSPAFIQAAQQASRAGAFCLALIPAVNDSGSGNATETADDYPSFSIPNNITTTYKNWWLCERYQLTQIEVTMKLGED